MTTIVGYLRTSTDSQDEGLETQRAEIEKWATAQGLGVSSWFTDEGISGSNGLETRLGLAECLAQRSAGIVVYKLDRLARDLVVQETILAEAKRQGTRIYSTLPTEDAYLQDDPADPTRKLIRQVLGAVADYERAMIRLRMSAGAARKRAEGGYAGGGVPFGYRVNPVTHDLEEAPGEQETLALMRELRKSHSLRSVASLLDAQGLQPRKGERWHPNSVARILEGSSS